MEGGLSPHKMHMFSSVPCVGIIVSSILCSHPSTHSTATFPFVSSQSPICSPLETSHIQPTQPSQHYQCNNPQVEILAYSAQAQTSRNSDVVYHQFRSRSHIHPSKAFVASYATRNDQSASWLTVISIHNSEDAFLSDMLKSNKL